MKSAISKGKLKLKRTGPDPMASAKSTPKQRSTLPGTVLEAIKPANVKKVLSEHARQLQSAVAFDSDGSHDADLADFMHDCTDIATLSINVVLDLGFPVDWCHESLQQMAGRWERTMMLNTSDKNEVDFSIDTPMELLQLVWPLLLASSADPERRIADAALLRMMKDAWDNGVKRPLSRPRATSIRADLDYIEASGDPRRASLDRGRARLSSLYKYPAWRHLPSTVKEHRMCASDMDRSFDSAPRQPLAESNRANKLADISAGFL